jgi:hypothetical protein
VFTGLADENPEVDAPNFSLLSLANNGARAIFGEEPKITAKL